MRLGGGKKNCDAGQIAIETLFGVVIILLGAIFVSLNIMSWNLQKDTLEQAYSFENTCNRLSLVISQVYSTGDKTRIDFWLDHNVSINKDNKLIFVENAFCPVGVKLKEDETLSAGRIIIKNSGGEVNLENA